MGEKAMGEKAKAGPAMRNTVVGGAVLVGLAAVATLVFASQPVVPDVSRPHTSMQRDWSMQQNWAQGDESVDTNPVDSQSSKKPAIDRSGAKRFGKASFYANFFAGRKMADGKIMDPHANNAASRTLPLGTTAKVTNLETGKSAVVTIQDRGPYVDGRIVDLSPATAQQIGISKRQGIAKVVVVPIVVPMPDGRVKLGAAANDPEVALNVPNVDNGDGLSVGGGW
jgi:rare lipoprotein A